MEWRHCMKQRLGVTICSLIFDHTKKINVVDYKGQTPKTLAEENGHLEVTKLCEK